MVGIGVPVALSVAVGVLLGVDVLVGVKVWLPSTATVRVGELVWVIDKAASHGATPAKPRL